MGLFGFFKKKGNFELVAENVAAIYCIVENSTFGRTLNKSQKMYATAVLDMKSYLTNDTIELEDMARAVLYANAGTVSLFPHKNMHGFMDMGKNSHIVNLAMQVEALVFNASTNVDAVSLLDMIVEEKESISSIVNDVMRQGTNGKIYKKLYSTIMMDLEDEGFQNIILVMEDFK